MRLYADEQYPYPVVKCLREFGHDVLTVQEAGKANQRNHQIINSKISVETT